MPMKIIRVEGLIDDPDLQVGDTLVLERADGKRSVWRQRLRVKVRHEHGYIFEPAGITDL